MLLEAANFEPVVDPRSSRSGSRSAPRARTAGRRASTRISPARRRRSRRSSRRALRRALDRRHRRAGERCRSGSGSSCARSGRARWSVSTCPTTEQREILEQLGFDVDADWGVTVPTWRARDVTREVDLVEEVARFVLDEVPFTLPRRDATFGRLTPLAAAAPARSRTSLVGCGLVRGLHADLRSPSTRRSGRAATAGAALGRGGGAADERSCRASSRRPARTSPSATTEIALFEIARVYLPWRRQRCRIERWHVGGIVEGGFAEAKGVGRAAATRR